MVDLLKHNVGIGCHGEQEDDKHVACPSVGTQNTLWVGNVRRRLEQKEVVDHGVETEAHGLADQKHLLVVLDVHEAVEDNLKQAGNAGEVNDSQPVVHTREVIVDVLADL